MSTVLVVDDSQTARHYHRNIIQAAGFKVVVANDGAAGLEAMFQQPCDLILTDINMALMNGYEFIRRIRFEPAFCGVPVIIISTESKDLDKKKGYAAGANLYITKPCRPELLIESIRMLMP